MQCIIMPDRNQSEMSRCAKRTRVACFEDLCVPPHNHSRPHCILEDEAEG